MGLSGVRSPRGWSRVPSTSSQVTPMCSAKLWRSMPCNFGTSETTSPEDSTRGKRPPLICGGMPNTNGNPMHVIAIIDPSSWILAMHQTHKLVHECPQTGSWMPNLTKCWLNSVHIFRDWVCHQLLACHLKRTRFRLVDTPTLVRLFPQWLLSSTCHWTHTPILWAWGKWCSQPWDTMRSFGVPMALNQTVSNPDPYSAVPVFFGRIHPQNQSIPYLFCRGYCTLIYLIIIVILIIIIMTIITSSMVPNLPFAPPKKTTCFCSTGPRRRWNPRPWGCCSKNSSASRPGAAAAPGPTRGSGGPQCPPRWSWRCGGRDPTPSARLKWGWGSLMGAGMDGTKWDDYMNLVIIRMLDYGYLDSGMVIPFSPIITKSWDMNLVFS